MIDPFWAGLAAYGLLALVVGLALTCMALSVFRFLRRVIRDIRSA